VLKQGQYSPLSVEKQVIQLYAATMKDENGQSWIRAVAVDKVGKYMQELLAFLDGRHADIAKRIAEKKQLDDEVKKALDAALKEFRGVFQA
jgi:F-type H+-transporting ATPase subunit alpha